MIRSLPTLGLLSALLLAGPLAAQTPAPSKIEMGAEIDVRLSNDTTWRRVVVGGIMRGDRTCLMLRLTPPDAATGDYILTSFKAAKAVRTRSADGQWRELPDADLRTLQTCSLE